MRRIIGDLFDESEVAVVEGDATIAEALLKKKFDHIFFTGSPAVGKIVMRAAAEHLTSVTLELGGKSPVIVDRTADLDEAAKKIAWGKSLNSGQVCIAPDYVLVDETVRGAFVEKLRARSGAESGLLVNDRHAARIRKLGRFSKSTSRCWTATRRRRFSVRCFRWLRIAICPRRCRSSTSAKGRWCCTSSAANAA